MNSWSLEIDISLTSGFVFRINTEAVITPFGLDLIATTISPIIFTSGKVVFVIAVSISFVLWPKLFQDHIRFTEVDEEMKLLKLTFHN